MTSQDLVKGIDITGLTEVTGSQINQNIDAGRPASDKGLIIVTTDTALDVPDVPNPDVLLEGVTPTHWTRYIWVRKPFDATGQVKTYCWNEQIDSDATLLKWEWQGQRADDAYTLAQTATTLAGTAQTEAEAATTQAINANNNAATALTAANTANTNAIQALTENDNQDALIQSLNSQVLSLQDLTTGLTIPVPLNMGGTGATALAGARNNLGLNNTPINFVLIKDKKAQGTNGGTFTQDAWQTRVLNTVWKATASHVTLNVDNTFTLIAGTYIIEAECPAYVVGKHQAKLAYEVDSVFVVHTPGSSERATSDGETPSKSKILALVDIDEDTNFKIEHYCEATKADNGFGLAANIPGSEEIYTQVKITILAA